MSNKVNDHICTDCGEDTNLICEVCGKYVCKECVEYNHKLGNFYKRELDKIICRECSCTYWDNF